VGLPRRRWDDNRRANNNGGGTMSTETTATTPSKPREEKLVFYHPNSSGTGAALQLEPRFNRRESDRYNCFFLDLATQKTAASGEGGRSVPATFDWEHKLTVKLDFADLCELLAVLEGKTDKAGGQRNGLYHDNGKACTIIAFQRSTEKAGYLLSLSKKIKQDGQIVRANFVLSDAEALGLRAILQVGLFFLSFHAQLLGGRQGEREAA
jgi:hypothetical protein